MNVEEEFEYQIEARRAHLRIHPKINSMKTPESEALLAEWKAANPHWLERRRLLAEAILNGAGIPSKVPARLVARMESEIERHNRPPKSKYSNHPANRAVSVKAFSWTLSCAILELLTDEERNA